jgi:hypothetical protein
MEIVSLSKEIVVMYVNLKHFAIVLETRITFPFTGKSMYGWFSTETPDYPKESKVPS